MFCVFARFSGLFAMSEIAVGSLFRVVAGAMAGGVLLRIHGIQRGRMVPWFLYVPRDGGGAERLGLSKLYLDRYCVEVRPVDLGAALMSRVLPYLSGKRMVMERLGCRGWGQLRLSTLRLKGRCLEDILFPQVYVRCLVAVRVRGRAIRKRAVLSCCQGRRPVRSAVSRSPLYVSRSACTLFGDGRVHMHFRFPS